jgi:ketosteroid isomerase-like protein
MRPAIRSGVLLFLLLSAAPAPAEEAAPAIAAANARFVRAFDKGDAATLAALYAENASVRAPDAATAEGRAAIERLWEGVIETGTRNLRLRPRALETLGDSASRETSRFELDTPTEGGGLARIEGERVALWAKEGEEWKIAADDWEVLLPAAGSSLPPRPGK